MNIFESFLSFGAVIRINRYKRDDLYRFIRCMLSTNFLKEYIVYFINSGKFCGDEKVNTDMSNDDIIMLLDEEYTDDYFWHLVDINEGVTSLICIEYQFGKGFTFGKEKNYRDFDKNIEIVNIEDIIKYLGLESEFGLDYIETFFKDELTDDKEDLASELDGFDDFYEWQLVKYKNGKYDILDTQTSELKGENETLKGICELVFGRMTDYNLMEAELEEIVEEGDIKYVRELINGFIMLGKKYNLVGDSEIDFYKKELAEYEEIYKNL